jgi:plastocyanin
MILSKRRHFPAICRWFTLIAVLAVPQFAQAQWNATVGAQSDDMGLQVMAFLPNEMWIHEGDSITWTFDVDEIHTVTFLRADQVRPFFPVGCPGFSTSPAAFDGSTCVTTNILIKPASFSVTFPKAGNFKVTCLVHVNMTGTIHVLKLSEPLPHTQSFYDAQAQARAEAILSNYDADVKDHAHHHAPNQIIAGTGIISGTTGGRDNLAVMRFSSHSAVIHVGETVEWSNVDPTTPHTITFGPEPANLMRPSPNVKDDTDGARHAVINSTSDNVHSGFIVAAPEEQVGLKQAPISVTRFLVTFTKAGTYHYICALHDDLGMVGDVTVLP